MLPKTETLLLRQDGPFLHLTLNRPEIKNAINSVMWTELEATFNAIEHDRSVRAVVIRGAGGAFCSGGDTRERGAQASESTADGDPLVARSERAGRLFAKIEEAPKVVIAVVEGPALGGGLGMVACADIAIAALDARFGLPEAAIGISAAQIMPFLIRRMGLSEVRRLALTAARFDGVEAQRVGLVHYTGADGAALDAIVQTQLDLIRRCAPEGIASTKRVIRAANAMNNEDFNKFAAEDFVKALRSPDGVEGALAAREKRPPSWAVKE
jgi:isohexenylglutaconyl-CoA hydratase